jgi:hypothetical protein
VENLENREKLGLLNQMVHYIYGIQRLLLGKMLGIYKDLLERKEIKVSREFRECLVRRAFKVSREFKVFKELAVLLD